MPGLRVERSKQRFSNKLIMPSWWVAAFDALAMASSRSSSPYDLSRKMGLAPALNRAELDSMGILLQQLQSQILFGIDEPRIWASEHQKAVSYQASGPRFAFERLLQLAGSLQLVTVQGDSHNVAWPLFDKVRWEEDRLRSDWKVTFSVGHDSDELILGYVEPYLELRRFWQKKERLGKYFIPKHPLKLWHSTWLDFQGIDQVLLLRIEKLMQWSQSQVHLDQSYEVSLAALFDGLKLRQSQTSELEPVVSDFMLKLRKIMRLGQKLAEHGVLRITDDHKYYPVDMRNAQIQLMWQATELYVSELDDDYYERKVCEYLAAKSLVHTEDLARMIAGPSLFDLVKGELTKFVDWFKSQLLSDGDFDASGFSLYCVYEDYPALVHPYQIYLEWSIRLMTDHPLPLPDWAIASPYAHAITQSNNLFDIGSYQSFIEIISQHPAPKRELRRLFSCCMACPAMLKNQELIRHLAKTTTRGIQVEKPEVLETKQIKAKQQVDVESTSRSVARSSKHQVLEALNHMRLNHSDKYEQLKTSYIKMLEPEKRKLVLEVKSRLQPKVFDDHLKNSLVKFMLEHPSLWQESSDLH